MDRSPPDSLHSPLCWGLIPSFLEEVQGGEDRKGPARRLHGGFEPMKSLAHLHLLQSHRLPVQQASGLVHLAELPAADLLLNLEVCQGAAKREGVRVPLEGTDRGQTGRQCPAGPEWRLLHLPRNAPRR